MDSAHDPMFRLTRGLWLLAGLVAAGIAFAWAIRTGVQSSNDALSRLDARAIAYGKAHGGYRRLTVVTLAGETAGPSLYLVHSGSEACLYYAGSYAILEDPATDQVRVYAGQCPFGSPPPPWQGPKA